MAYFYQPNSLYFITYKTYHSLNYFDTDYNKQVLKEQILSSSIKNKVKVISYAILSNHYHMLIDEANENSNTTNFIQMINGGSSFRIQKPTHTKTIWNRENKYSSLVQNESGMFDVMGYIVGNPLKHGIVKDFNGLGKYEFCNYNEMCNEYEKGLIDNLVLNTCELNFESNESFDRISKSLK